MAHKDLLSLPLTVTQRAEADHEASRIAVARALLHHRLELKFGGHGEHNANLLDMLRALLVPDAAGGTEPDVIRDVEAVVAAGRVVRDRGEPEQFFVVQQAGAAGGGPVGTRSNGGDHPTVPPTVPDERVETWANETDTGILTVAGYEGVARLECQRGHGRVLRLVELREGERIVADPPVSAAPWCGTCGGDCLDVEGHGFA